MKIILLIIILAGGYYFYQNSTSSIPKVNASQLHPSVLDLKKDIDSRIISKNDIRTLSSAFYKTSTHDAKQYTIRLVALSLLAVDPASYPKFKNKIAKDYPDKDYLSFMEKEFSDSCTSCDGHGSGVCTKCKGSAKCSNRKCDKGRIIYEGVGQAVNNPCPICRGKDECSSCIGSGRSYSACSTCKGSGFKNSRKKAQELYRQSLKSL